MKKVICFFVCVLICIGFSVKAQVTTSVLGGKIIDDQNEYVIGATVVAVHEPSGTMYGAVTNVDGRYTIIIRKTKNSSFKNEKSKKEVDVTITASNKDIV